MVELQEMSREELAGCLESEVQALLRDAFSHDPPAYPDYYAPYGTPEMILVLREERVSVSTASTTRSG